MQVDHASGYIKEKNGNKYLIFDDSVDENKKVLKKYSEVWDGIEDKIKAIGGGKENDNEKGYMKIKFNSDDDLPLSIAIIRSVFQEDGKIYPQFFFRRHFVWIAKMLQDETISVSEEIDVNKTSASKKCLLCHYWYFRNVAFKFKPHVCNITMILSRCIDDCL